MWILGGGAKMVHITQKQAENWMRQAWEALESRRAHESD